MSKILFNTLMVIFLVALILLYPISLIVLCGWCSFIYFSKCAKMDDYYKRLNNYEE